MLVKKVIPSHPQKYSNVLYWNPYSNLPHKKKLDVSIFWSEILFTPSWAHLYCSHIILPILYMYIFEYVHIFVLFVHISIYITYIYIISGYTCIGIYMVIYIYIVYVYIQKYIPTAILNVFRISVLGIYIYNIFQYMLIQFEL